MTAHRVGIMGGTFDPVHDGHLIAARQVADALDLELVLFSPVASPWHKDARELAPAADRIAMLDLALEDFPDFSLVTVDVDRGGDTYTLDTLNDLAEGCAVEYPGHDFDWFFIAGADAISGLARWKAPEELLQRAHFVAVTRPGFDFIRPVVAGAERILALEIDAVDVSSTRVRELAAEGASLEGLVPEPVEEYIYDHGLYSSLQS
ncbi:MAG: nicotinate-nucleotide adenylyltransferase [Candidatus Nanopelagicales bacterium]